MSSRRFCILVAALAFSLVPTAAKGTIGPQAGTARTQAAVWEMDEMNRGAVMLDSSGNGQHGSIGSDVITGVDNGSTNGYRWSFTSPTAPPAKPERLVTVADNDLLDPGSDTYSVSFRFKTTRSFGNYLQKGQATTPGGQMKVQAPKGRVSCLFKGSKGRSATSSKTPLNDGQWHVVTCRKDKMGVTMYVDGEFRNRNRRDAGHINNSFPFTIGGKPKCDQVRVTCDYFVGHMDWVRVDVG